MNKTSIEWTDFSWNPVTGCLNKCSYCYARRIYKRFGRSFKPAFHPERLSQPFKKKKPSRIFVCSVADLMGDWVPRKWINNVINITENFPRHTFQFLTKNPKRYNEFDWPENAWLGATATDQVMANRAQDVFQNLIAGE